MTLLSHDLFDAKVLPSLSTVCGFRWMATDFDGFHRILMDYLEIHGSPRYFTMSAT